MGSSHCPYKNPLPEYKQACTFASSRIFYAGRVQLPGQMIIRYEIYYSKTGVSHNTYTQDGDEQVRHTSGTVSHGLNAAGRSGLLAFSLCHTLIQSAVSMTGLTTRGSQDICRRPPILQWLRTVRRGIVWVGIYVLARYLVSRMKLHF